MCECMGPIQVEWGRTTTWGGGVPHSTHLEVVVYTWTRTTSVLGRIPRVLEGGVCVLVVRCRRRNFPGDGHASRMARETPWCLQREKIRWMESCERYLVSVRHERVEVVNAGVTDKVPAAERHGVRKIVGGSQGVKTPRTSQIFVLVVSVECG